MASRDLVVHIIGDDRSYQRALKESTAATAVFDRQMTQSARGAAAGSGAFASMGRSVAFASGTFLGAAGLTAVLKNSISAASNLAEQTNKVRAVFKDSARDVEAFATTTARTMGIANDQALQAAGTFGNLFNTVGVAPALNARLSTSLVKLAADLASFNNASPEDALDALRSGLIGEAEPLRRFGVLLTEVRVQQEAMRETGKQSATQLTQQEKLLARYNLILKDTSAAQGDFARTAEGLANKQRTLTAEMRDSQARIGKGLVPATLLLIDTFNKLLDVTDAVGDAINKLGSPFRWLGSRILSAGSATAGQIKPITILDNADRQFGRAPGGAAPFPAIGPGSRRWRASLVFQSSLMQMQLAQAELTAGQRDDRSVLVRAAALTRRRITAAKDLKLRTQLTQDLVAINSQIKGIDDKAAAERQAAADREKTAKEKQLALEKERLENHRRHIRAVRDAWAKQLEALRAAADAVRGEMGPLPIQATPAGILGVRGQTASGFAGAYATQTRTFVRFYNDLARLGRRGAPAGLVEQFRAGGLEAAGTVRGLLAGRPGALRSLIRSFREREKVVQQIAHADIQARNVVIHMAGSRTGATNASTRRGRQAGVPTSIGSYIGG